MCHTAVCSKLRKGFHPKHLDLGIGVLKSKQSSKQLFLVVQKAVLLQKVGPHQVEDVLHLPPRHQHLHLLHHLVHQSPCAFRPCKASASAASALVEASTKAQNGSRQSSDLEGCGPR